MTVVLAFFMRGAGKRTKGTPRTPLILTALAAMTVITASTGGALYAAGLQEGRDPKETVIVKAAALTGPSGFGMIRMFEFPPELGEGGEIEFQVLPTPPEMVARVAGRELDVAVFPSNMAAKLYTEGPGYRLGAVVGMGVLSLLSGNPSVVSWDDLRGQTIHSVGKGASPDYLLNYFLAEVGLEPGRDVTIDFSLTNGARLAQMLIAGKVENAVLPQPFVTMVMEKSPGIREVLDFQEAWKMVQGSVETYPMTVVVFRPEFAEEHPEIAKAFLEEYRRSIEWVNSNPLEAAQLIEKYGVMPAAIAAPAIPRCNLKFIPAAEAKTLMESYLQVLLDFNPASVGGRLPDDGFYFSPER